MALIVQNNSGTMLGANSYVSFDDAINYFVDRQVEFDDDEKLETALIEATTYIDVTFGSRFWGAKIAEEQETEWPRVNAFSDIGYDYSGIIHFRLMRACYEYAKIFYDTNELFPSPTYDDSSQLIKSKTTKVPGAVESSVTYHDSGKKLDTRKYPKADGLLSPLMSRQSNVTFFRRA